MKNTHQSEAFGFSKCSHMLWRKSSAWQCALQMYYKFSAWCFRYNYLNLCIKVMTSEFQHLHLQGLLHTSRQNLWAYWKWWLGFNRDMFECCSDGNHWKSRSSPQVRMYVCLCIPLFSTNTLSEVSPTMKSYIILAFWKRFEHPNFPWKRYFVRLLSATLVWLLHLTKWFFSLCVA